MKQDVRMVQVRPEGGAVSDGRNPRLTSKRVNPLGTPLSLLEDGPSLSPGDSLSS